MLGCEARRNPFMMLKKWIIAAVAVAVIGPAWLAAQQSPRPPRAPRAPRGFAFSYSDNRGRIGVVVRTDASPESDKLGAKLEAVTPGGPAEKAGLKAGDIITKFNGTGLAGVKSEDEDESGPGKKLIELARKLAPGDTVQIEYRRGGDTKTATLVAEDIDMAWSFVAPHIAPTPMPHLDGPEMMMEPRAFGFCFGDSWCELDLVTLNGDLGEYFGTKEGILVVKAPADSSLPLEARKVRTCSSTSCPVVKMMRSACPGSVVWSSRYSSSPETSGIRMSTITASNLPSRSRPSASRPLDVVSTSWPRPAR